MEYLQSVLELIAGLVGFPAFLAALINVLKVFGLPDDKAGVANLVGHLIAYVGVGVLVFLGKIDILSGLDVSLGNVANVLLSLLALLSSLGIAKGFHGVLRGLPVIGKSYSYDEWNVIYKPS